MAIYSQEIKEILNRLTKELFPGTVLSTDLVIAILEKYYKDSDVEDLVMVALIKKHLGERKTFKDLIEDMIEIHSSGKPVGAVLEVAEKITEARDGLFPIVNVTDILEATFRTETDIPKILEKYGIGPGEFGSVRSENSGVFEIISKFLGEMFKDKSDSSEGFMESAGISEGPKIKKSSSDETPLLDLYARNLVEEKLDPIYGRDNELSQLLEILGCKKKNNAILIGEAGVGKTSVVELLAQRIKSCQVPKSFLGRKIYSLNLNSLVAGTKYRGQFEERLQGIIDEVLGHPEVIVFIDEIHNLIGSGGSEGNGDAANILKPYLSKGLFQCIGSTTFKEYRKYIESDAALKRRFQTIIVEEPTAEETKEILKNIKDVYEKYHSVVYPKEVISACVDLSGRYLSSARFPDKAIDALDLSGSLSRLSASAETTKTYLEKKREIEEVQNQKITAVGKEDFEEAIRLRDKEAELKEALEVKDAPLKVSLEDVYRAIGKRSGVPIDTIGSSDLEKLRKLKTILEKEVIGQEKAIREIVLNLQKNSLQVRDQSKPVSLLFTGPTGCGKTYLCKRLAQEFYGSMDALIRFDMGEYKEGHSISKLIGATASYVGYNDEPLFEKIRHKPYSVVLFDEIEKAAPEIFQVFLNILDEGYVTLGNGVKVDFRNCIIIFTGNIGTKEVSQFGKGIGYGAESKSEERKDSIIGKAIEKTFAPEFINRLSKIVMFSTLGEKELKGILDLELGKLSGRLKESKISLKATKAMKEYILKQCDLKYGARDLQRKISETIEEKLCEKLLETGLGDKKSFSFDYKNDEIIVNCK